ncbi:chascon isoform d-related [Anaeramoeba ignava]|uniref:Chascon isoform d-related n=1 Tax=Anaeramoeba ignava TaxID=1746090 RepID=A0A9Q0L6Z8_ANAIG|nr:chascon isoform d-related [Anaeramoeba ignava]
MSEENLPFYAQIILDNKKDSDYYRITIESIQLTFFNLRTKKEEKFKIQTDSTAYLNQKEPNQILLYIGGTIRFQLKFDSPTFASNFGQLISQKKAELQRLKQEQQQPTLEYIGTRIRKSFDCVLTTPFGLQISKVKLIIKRKGLMLVEGEFVHFQNKFSQNDEDIEILENKQSPLHWTIHLKNQGLFCLKVETEEIATEMKNAFIKYLKKFKQSLKEEEPILEEDLSDSKEQEVSDHYSSEKEEKNQNNENQQVNNEVEDFQEIFQPTKNIQLNSNEFHIYIISTKQLGTISVKPKSLLVTLPKGNAPFIYEKDMQISISKANNSLLISIQSKNIHLVFRSKEERQNFIDLFLENKHKYFRENVQKQDKKKSDDEDSTEKEYKSKSDDDDDEKEKEKKSKSDDEKEKEKQSDDEKEKEKKSDDDEKEKKSDDEKEKEKKSDDEKEKKSDDEKEKEKDDENN